MSSAVKGFPEKFPVRDDDRRPLRYRTATLLSRITLLVIARRLRIEGEANVPAEGPLLVACNHTSNLDPAVMGSYFPHMLFAMAKRELYSPPALAWFLAGVNCIPVDRGGADRRARNARSCRQLALRPAALLTKRLDAVWQWPLV